MESKTIQVGLIGCGFGASTHIPGFQACNDAEVVAVCDIQQEIAEQFARKFNIPHIFTDYKEMLKLEDLDLVSVASPIYLHYPMITEVIASGRHILSEKPLAMNAKEASDLLTKASAAGVVHAIDHEFRFLPAHLKMKALVDEGYLGDLHTVNIRVANTGALRMRGWETWGWYSQKEKGGGMLNSSGYHYIDLIRFWFGEIGGVFGRLETIVKERPILNSSEMGTVNSDDVFSLLLHLRNGGLVSINANTTAFHGGGTRIEAYGSQGTLVIDSHQQLIDGRVVQAGRLLLGGRKDEDALVEIPVPEEPTPGGMSSSLPQVMAFYNLANQLIQAIKNKSEISPNFFDGVKNAEITDAIRQSAATNKWVPLP